MSDIEIAQKAKMLPISKIGKKIGIKTDEFELYGGYKAKIKNNLWKRIKKRKDGKLILVTAMNPTPMGEGKTTTSIGLAQAMAKLGKKTVLSLREPSLGPCFGIKGGAAGGGYSQVLPMEDINLHFTGDIHAVSAANNLLSALIDNHIYHGNQLEIDKRSITWKRCLDMNDRALRKIRVGLSEKKKNVSREDDFNISVASEVMAILCLAENIEDLRKRLGKIIVCFNKAGKPVFAKDLKAHGAMAALLKDALKPNLVQTLEHGPVLIHGGPFANIAHGCSSIIATRHGLKLADYFITEAGFGADLGAEKFFNIKCRVARLKPGAVVLVATIRSLKYNGSGKNSIELLKTGFENIKKHIENIRKFNVQPVVAINVFPNDKSEELQFVKDQCSALGVESALSYVHRDGGLGGIDLARKVLKAIQSEEKKFTLLYADKLTIRQKITKIAREIYGASGVNYSQKAEKQLKKISALKLGKLPVCMAKTQYSLSDNPALLGRPKGFRIFVNELRISNGAGFIVAICGKIMTMPGLPKKPAAEKIDVDQFGNIKGLF